MRNVQSSIAILVLASTSACASGVRSTPALEGSVREETSYEFAATIPFSDNVTRATRTWELSGVLVRLGDSLFVHPKARCQLLAPEAPGARGPKGMPTGAGFARAYCNGAWLAFNRENPTSARWYTWLSRPRERELCLEYGTKNGRQVCLRRDIRTYYDVETRSGAIKVKQLGKG